MTLGFMTDKPNTRGYFGIGAEGISKPMNLGALLRTAHAFHASFCFAIGAAFDVKSVLAADTSMALDNMPVQLYPDVASFKLPLGCRLVGIEITDDAIELPSFTHPPAAAYVLGAERDSLSPELQARCDFIVRVPTGFCVNLAVAGSIVMYDRMISLGRFAERPVRVGGPRKIQPAGHQHGLPVWKRKQLKKHEKSR